MNASVVKHILQEHVPPEAVAYCLQLWEESPFELKLTKTRQTKVGDFTSKRSRLHPRITLNHDLNPYLFLMRLHISGYFFDMEIVWRRMARNGRTHSPI
jgi:SprT protein